MENTNTCNLCNSTSEVKECDHSKNGYCKVFIDQAKLDAIEYGMKPSIHSK